MRGFKSLAVGMTVPVTLINTDSVHGFIDFEYVTAENAVKIRSHGTEASGRADAAGSGR